MKITKRPTPEKEKKQNLFPFVDIHVSHNSHGRNTQFLQDKVHRTETEAGACCCSWLAEIGLTIIYSDSNSW